MTLESVVELRMLASVPTQIVSPQASKPVMGMVQDSTLGTYLLSLSKQINMKEMMQLMCSASCFDEQLPLPAQGTDIDDPRWTGQQLISMYMPEITYKKSARGGQPKVSPVNPMPSRGIDFGVSADEKNGKISIIGGQMSTGILDGNAVGKKANGIFHITWNDYGPSVTRDLFNNVSRTANTWLMTQGFSCGISDCVIPHEAQQRIRDSILEAKKKASDAIQSAKMGTVPETESLFSYKTGFPAKIMGIMSGCLKAVEKETTNSITEYNSIDIMVKSGSKGSENNLTQIVGMLGQQDVEGNWIEDQFYHRTLPHYHRDDLRPEAHGFVQNSFTSGLNPAEYWFHAQGGRIGVIAKGIKTAETGYIQRKLIKVLEDIHMCYDGTVRNANNMIVQTVYGNDGFDACYLEQQDMFFMNYNMERMCQRFKHTGLDNMKTVVNESVWDEFEKSTKKHVLDAEFKQICDYQKYLKETVPLNYLQPSVKMPINFARLIANTSTKFDLNDIDSGRKTDLSPIYVAEKVSQLRDKLMVDPNKTINFVSTVILKSLMSIYLSSKVMIYEHKFTKVAFDNLLEIVYMTFLKSLVNPGENVGIIAAQSLGEPTTQMALSAIHLTGQGSKANISRGTPRLKELMGVAKKQKTPSMTVYINDDHYIQVITGDPKQTKQINDLRTDKIGAEIEYTTLKDILLRTEIFYDESDFASCVHEDKEFIDSYYSLLPDTDPQYQQQTSMNWLLRMEFDRSAIIRKHIPMYLIQQKLSTEFENKGITNSIIVSDDNAQKLICRIKIDKDLSDDTKPVNFLRDLESKLLGLHIKGISGVEQCITNPIKRDIVLPDGTIISQFDSNQNAYEEAKKKYNNWKYKLDTEGSNLVDIMCLPNIDTYNTITNDFWEIYELYGIEAARKCIIMEINQLLEESGSSVQERHVTLLVDVMTNQGTLVSVDRHGVNKTESGPLHRASFEETSTQIVNASIFNEADLMTGVSANIMFGQFIHTGTNAFKIGLDIEKVKKQVHPKQDMMQSRVKAGVVQEVMDLTDVCADENFEFNFKLKEGGQSPP